MSITCWTSLAIHSTHVPGYFHFQALLVNTSTLSMWTSSRWPECSPLLLLSRSWRPMLMSIDGQRVPQCLASENHLSELNYKIVIITFGQYLFKINFKIKLHTSRYSTNVSPINLLLPICTWMDRRLMTYSNQGGAACADAPWKA